MIPQKLFFDTNVLNELDKLPQEELAALMQKVSDRYEYAVSPFTGVELLVGMVKSNTTHPKSEEYFKGDIRKLALLCGDHQLMPHPIVFALNTVLGFSIKDDSQAPFRNLLDAVMKCRNQAELDTVILDRENFSNRVEKARKKNTVMLRRIQDSDPTIRRPNPIEWVRHSLNTDLYAIGEVELKSLADNLTAAIAFNDFLVDAATESYNFTSKKHDGDLIDIHQLTYLCDPTMHMVTADRRLIERVTRSSQAQQIIQWSQFVVL